MTAMSLYDKARDRGRLWNAWELVNGNAKSSGSSKTREEAERFRNNLRLNIERIARKLRERTFTFEPQRGVAIPKSDGKSRRPLVVAPISNRIVQRSLLETLQELPLIRTQLHSGFNFGGVEDKGVPQAVMKVASLASTYPYFIRTDISGFFQNVRRQEALDALLTGIEEQEFKDLVTSAVTTELDDATQHLEETGIFPLYEEGVAQGSCLSPLLCNVLLHPFDVQMNDRGVVTVRYIDDFILLSRSESAARGAFKSAQKWLTSRGLSCYDPYNPSHSKKAEHGFLTNGATFLGCEIVAGTVRPSRDNFRGIQNKIHNGLLDSLKALNNPKKAQMNHKTFAETLVWASQTIRGWANTFGFCSDERLFRSIDSNISQLLHEYEHKFIRKRSQMNTEDARRSIGVFLLQDRKRDTPKKQSV